MSGRWISTASWAAARATIGAPFRIPGSLLALMALVPLYIFIPQFLDGRPAYRPAIALDARIALQPAWSIVYGTLYAWLIVTPFFVVRSEERLRRTLRAYLVVWLVSYACFVAWPTIGPRPDELAGGGFFVTSLRFLYSADTPYNCLPSIHVGHSFVSAVALALTHRRVGVLAFAAATLVAASTLFTKQHYVLDAISGALLAAIACAIFLWRDGDDASEAERVAAPALAAAVMALVILALFAIVAAYRLLGI